MSFQPPHKIFKTTLAPEKLLGGTPKQARKINELEKVENKAGPVSSIRSRDASFITIGGSAYNLPCEAQTHDNDDGRTFAIEAHGKLLDSFSSSPFHNHYDNHGEGPQTHDGRTSAFIQMHDGKSSSNSLFSNHYVNDIQQYDNGSEGPQTHDERASTFIQTHDGIPSSNPPYYYANDIQAYDNGEGPQTHDGRASAFIQMHDGKPSSNPLFTSHYANDIRQYNNDEGLQTNGEGEPAFIPNSQAHDKTVSTIIFNPSGRASSSSTHSNYYARIPSTLNNPQDPRDPFILSSQAHDASSTIIFNPSGRASSSSTHSNYYARIPSILNNPQDPFILSSQAHDASTIIFNLSGRASSSSIYSNYYARIPSILNDPQDPRDHETLPPFPWVLDNLINNNSNKSNGVSLPSIYNNSTHQKFFYVPLRPLEPDYKPEDPKLPFQL